jgi:hypothetical protein
MQTGVILEEAEELWVTEMNITTAVSYSELEPVKALIITGRDEFFLSFVALHPVCPA